MRIVKSCDTFMTGIGFPVGCPHTINIYGRLTSIEYGDCVEYYMKDGFSEYAIAIDTKGRKYTIYAKNFPEEVIAIPIKEVCGK